MFNRDSSSPWNPETPVDVSPKGYEKQVLRWLQQGTDSLQDFQASHLKRLSGPGGEYEFDVVAEFTLFGGASVVVLVECKHYKNPVKREAVMVLDTKLREVGAHKGMMFSTSGFQKGALKYATAHGIATITFVDGKSTYETKDYGQKHEPPPWVKTFPYVGIFTDIRSGNVHCHRIDDDYLDAVAEWFSSLSEVLSGARKKEKRP